jgi:hypothetical protein
MNDAARASCCLLRLFFFGFSLAIELHSLPNLALSFNDKRFLIDKLRHIPIALPSAAPMPNLAINGANYLSAPQIARDLRRNHVSIYRVIKRKRIQPAFELSGLKFYSRAAVAKIEKSMRRRNGHGNGNGS